jgi:DNA-binding transcriptional LysR family regulator
MEVNTMDTARQMVLHGLGWTILPLIGLTKDDKDDSLHTRPLFWPDGSAFVRRTSVLCTEGASGLLTVRAFLDYLKRWQGSPLSSG